MIDYVSRHGEIVDALHAWRKSREMPKKARLVKNVFIDLGVVQGKDLVEVFEVKPNSARPSIYAGVGQLMVHGRAQNCRRSLVLPHDEVLAADLVHALVRLDVNVLRFRLSEAGAAILDGT